MPADAITIVDGATDALDLVTSKVLQFGDRVAVEHPAYPPLLDLLEAVGARTVALDLDDDGPTPGSVSAAVEAGVRAVFLQCRAQNPTGASVTAERAEELAAIIRGREVVVELDLGAAIASTPLTSLGAHLPDRTIHIRAYSESHGPDLRLAAIGGSSVQMDQLIRRRHLGQGWTSRLLQHLLLDLLTHEESRRQVAAAREEYARRREALVGALAGHGIEVGGKDGITLWVPVENQAAALMMLSSHGLGVAPGGPYLVRADGEPHVAVTVGLLPAEKAPGVAAVLAQAARPSARSAIH
jgi:DNA-binding transcriptional MocR family regulator